MKNTILLLLLALSIPFAEVFCQALTEVQKEELALLHNMLEKYELERLAARLDEALFKENASEDDVYQNHLLLMRAALQKEQGRYRHALQTAEQAVAIFREREDRLALAGAMVVQASLLIILDRNEPAEALLKQALLIHQEQGDTQSPAYANTIFHLGLLKVEQEAYAQVDSLYAAALNLVEGEPSLLHARILYQQAKSKLEQEDFPLVEAKLGAARQLLETQFGEEHPEMAFVWFYLGRYYSKVGNSEKAREITRRGLDLRLQAFGNQHPLYAKLLLNQAILNFNEARYDLAEEDFLRVKDIYQEAYGETFHYADVSFYLGYCYYLLGQTPRAVEIWTSAKDIYAKSGKMVDYANVLSGLAFSFIDLGQLERAEELYLEGRTLLKDSENSVFYASVTTNLAELYAGQERFADAEPLFFEARKLVADLYGTEHTLYAGIINNLASLYRKTGQYQLAKQMFLETAVIDRSTVGQNHPDHIITLYNLAKINELTNQPDSAFYYYKRANDGQLGLIQNYYSTFDEATRLSYLEQIQMEFDQFFSFVLNNTDHPDQVSFLTEMQNVHLAIKRLALDFSIENRAFGSDANDTTLIAAYSDWLALRKELGEAYVLSEEERQAKNIQLTELEQKVELAEKHLARSQHKTTLENTAWRTIANRLADSETAIDYIKFKYALPERKTDSVYYCALVTRAGDQGPKLVFLAEEKDLTRILRSDVIQGGNNFVERPEIGYDLYQLLWKPLEPYLKGINKIKLSPSGLVHKVAFAALPLDRGGRALLASDYQFDYYSNLRDLTSAVKANPVQKSAALIGGAHFELDSVSLVRIAQQPVDRISETAVEELPPRTESDPATRAIEIDPARSSVTFHYLPGTRREVQRIGQQFRDRKWRVQTFLGDGALEDRVKLLEGKSAPAVLHIATHGYFFTSMDGTPETDDLRTRILFAKDPLLRSGLVLTGANHSWKGGKRIPGLEDGILTAYEIANLDLFRTDLVVLSACETGLGDIYDTEGVFGLQRAFKTAGVEKLIISLWKVPDEQTQELMTIFYRYYLRSGDAPSALHRAQRKMQNRYAPYYWAGFILLR